MSTLQSGPIMAADFTKLEASPLTAGLARSGSHRHLDALSTDTALQNVRGNGITGAPEADRAEARSASSAAQLILSLSSAKHGASWHHLRKTDSSCPSAASPSPSPSSKFRTSRGVAAGGPRSCAAVEISPSLSERMDVRFGPESTLSATRTDWPPRKSSAVFMEVNTPMRGPVSRAMTMIISTTRTMEITPPMLSATVRVFSCRCRCRVVSPHPPKAPPPHLAEPGGDAFSYVLRWRRLSKVRPDAAADVLPLSTSPRGGSA
mmetsp:Transcript_20108/g.42669  ORF Transcript_20108/g.42669 Transcript_20108/m.42669 type:complete len:263 (+) Transcript_20108:100-888(+)